MNRATIVYIIDPDQNKVLMAKKTRKVGVGFWFGYGGKIEPGETPLACTCRETYTESGEGIVLKEEDLDPVALIDFYNGTEKEVPFGDPSFQVLCYRCFVFEGKAITTEEMKDPTWFPIDILPIAEMKPGDELFVPQIIIGIPIKGWIRSNKKTNTLIDHSLQLCSIHDLKL